MRRLAEMLLLLIFLLLLLISAIFLIFTANRFCSFILAIAFVYFLTYLEDLSPIKVNRCLIGYNNLNKNKNFCDWKRRCVKRSFVSNWTRVFYKNSIKGKLKYDWT